MNLVFDIMKANIFMFILKLTYLLMARMNSCQLRSVGKKDKVIVVLSIEVDG